MASPEMKTEKLPPKPSRIAAALGSGIFYYVGSAVIAGLTLSGKMIGDAKQNKFTTQTAKDLALGKASAIALGFMAIATGFGIVKGWLDAAKQRRFMENAGKETQLLKSQISALEGQNEALQGEVQVHRTRFADQNPSRKTEGGLADAVLAERSAAAEAEHVRA